MSEVVFPSEALPEINWENPLTDGLVALFMLDGDDVVEVISGTRQPVTTAESSSWGETVTFDIAAMGIDVNEGDGYSLIASANSWLVRTTGTSGVAIRFGDSGNYVDFIEDTSYSGTYPAFGGNYSKGSAAASLSLDSGAEVLAMNFKFSLASRTYINWQIFNNGVLGDGSQGQSGYLTDRPEFTLYNRNFNLVAIYRGYRTAEQFAEIKPNPFALLKEKRKFYQEHGLFINSAQQSVTIPFTGTGSVVFRLSDGSTYVQPYDGTYVLDGSTPRTVVSISALADSGEEYLWDLNLTEGETVVDSLTGLELVLSGFPHDSGYVYDNLGNIEGYLLDGGYARGNIPTTTEYTATLDITYLGNGYIFAMNSQVRGVDLRNNRLYIFTKYNVGDYNTSYSYGKTLEIGDRLTLKVYENQVTGVRRVYLDDVLIGDNLAATGSSLPLSTITLGARADSVGVRTPMVLHQLIVEDHTNDLVHTYNGNMVDTDQVIDSTGNAHLNHTSNTESKWQPIVPTDIYTVGPRAGTPTDYPDIVAWGAAVSDNSGYQKALCYGTQELTTDFDHRTDFLDGGEICGATGEFSGDFNDTEIAVITRNALYTGWLFDDRTNRLTYRNLIIAPVDGYTYYTHSLVKAFDRIGITGTPTEGSIYLSSSELDLTIKNSHLRNEAGGQVLYVRNGSVNSINSVFTSEYDSVYGILRLRDCDAILTNNVVKTSTGTGIGNTSANITGSNNISSDSSASDEGIGQGNIDLTGAFVDEDGGDFSINQSWAENNLAGKGWNGTDIVKWAYNDSDDPGSVPVNNIYIGSRPVSDVKYFDGVSLKDVNLYINGETVWST